MKPDENDLSKVRISEYLDAHAKKGYSWHDFVRSNLFAALVIWFLGQSVLVGGLFVTLVQRTSRLNEWKGGIDAIVKRMDEQGTNSARYQLQEIEKDLTDLKSRIKRTEEDTGHLDVLESEHRRLTKDVEELKLKEKK